MSDLVQDVEDIRSNLMTVRDYLTSQNDEELVFARERLRLGSNLVAAVVEGDVVFGPSRVVGYKGITLKRHRELGQLNMLDGKQTDPAISRLLGNFIRSGDSGWDEIESLFHKLCDQVGVAPGNKRRKFWAVGELTADLEASKQMYKEGALAFFVSSRFERSAAARKACIDTHGVSCIVCGFNFEQVFGEHGKGFIHVHHLRPLYKADADYKTDPKMDLVPVCPNCHYMLHRGGKDLSPDALRSIMKPK